MAPDSWMDDGSLQVPTKAIPRRRFPDQLSPEQFKREFVEASEPVIIEGLVDSWPAMGQGDRSWRGGDRWRSELADEMLDCGFDPADNRMMHFGDESGEPDVLFNPGRVRMPAWAFLESASLRQEILRLEAEEGQVDLARFPELKDRLNREVTVQNVPFLEVDKDSPLHHFSPIPCRLRDLVPLAFYLSHDTSTLPPSMQKDVFPQADRLMPEWASPVTSRIWVTSGGPWRSPYPPWSSDNVPEPQEDPSVYSCFHCDRMENLHSVIAGEKRVVLVPPGQRDVLRSTRYSKQRQWLLASAASQRGNATYLGSTHFTSKQGECSSDQSAVHPLRDAEFNRAVSGGQWPDRVDFPVRVGELRAGDTLYLPAYHWHWVATRTPPALGRHDEGPLAMSVNFWWWPMHNDGLMGDWSFQNEEGSWRNARCALPADLPPPDRGAHGASFRSLTQRQREATRAATPVAREAAASGASETAPVDARVRSGGGPSEDPHRQPEPGSEGGGAAGFPDPAATAAPVDPVSSPSPSFFEVVD